MVTRTKLMRVYESLLREFGPQGWWPVVGGKSLIANRTMHRRLAISDMHRSFEIAIGAILTQNTAWTNVEKAIRNLIAARAMDPKKIVRMPSVKLQQLIRPAGYFRQKAKKLKIFSKWYLKNYKSALRLPTSDLRSQLLAIWGVGPETADSILLYAFGRPVFIVDTYTRWFIVGRGLVPRRGRGQAPTLQGDGYHDIQQFFTDRLPRSTKLYNEFHALIVAWGKTRSLGAARDDTYGTARRP